jgi:hypothetical protein
LLMLIMFLALLPLTLSYAASALESAVDGSHSMDCQGDDCDMQHAMPGEDEECCQQQCDSSFGSQICSERTLTLEASPSDSYVEAATPETPTPLPDRLLRPPLHSA